MAGGLIRWIRDHIVRSAENASLNQNAPVGGTAGGGNRILLTGAAGGVAGMIRPALARDAQELRLSDRSPIKPLASNERSIAADLRSARAIEKAVRGVDAIVHLGGISKESAWERLLANNVRGTINLFEAARRHGVTRVVMASSMHVMGFYGRDENFSEDSPARPDTRYAVSKLCAEAVGRLFAEKYGLSVTCLRIGHVTETIEQADPGNWIAPGDLIEIVKIGLARTDPGFVLIHAATPYDGSSITDGRLARSYGFTYRSPGGDYQTAVRAAHAHYAKAPVAQRHRGGGFASTDADMV